MDPCPEGKVYKPATNRCVGEETRTYKQMQGLVKSQAEREEEKAKQKDKYVLGDKGRYVRKDRKAVSPEYKLRMFEQGVNPCPEGKVYNPATNRCVGEETRTYKQMQGLVKSQAEREEEKAKQKDKYVLGDKGRYVRKDRKAVSPEYKLRMFEQGVNPCPEGKVFNPNTKRCVKKQVQKQ